mgnify:FL=1
MRMPTLAVVATALATTALVAGAGTAAADAPGAEEELTPETRCLITETFAQPRCLNLLPSTDLGRTAADAGAGSLGGLVTGSLHLGSMTLSLDIPNSTGSYAPGSHGSYGPEAAIGRILVGSVGPLGGSII